MLLGSKSCFMRSLKFTTMRDQAADPYKLMMMIGFLWRKADLGQRAPRKSCFTRAKQSFYAKLMKRLVASV